MTHARPHVESGQVKLRSWASTSLPYFSPRLRMACFGTGGGGGGLGGALGVPDMLAHLLIGPSCRSLEGTSSAAWCALLAAARLLGWRPYLWL